MNEKQMKSETTITPTTGGQAPEGTQADAEATFGRVLQFVRAVQNGMQNIDRGHGLSGSQLFALWHISAHPGLKVSELAGAMHIRHSTASNLLDKLEGRALTRRERQTTDTRVVRLHLTPEGEAIVKDLPGPLQGRLRKALQALSAAELAGLSGGIAKLLEILDIE